MSDPSPQPSGPPWLGRFVALALVALALMVGLGIFWVWNRAERERSWRERVNAAEPFTPLQRE